MEHTTHVSSRQIDFVGAALFGILTATFIVLMATNTDLWNWAWDRHHNILSWYIRPLALLPFMLFAYKRSLTGMAFSIFALATSMAWFPAPETVDPTVSQFLNMEIEYLTTDWTIGKIIGSLLVPLMFILLGTAFWQRSFVYGGMVLIANVVLKMGWGVMEGGESGWAMLPPALTGLGLTLVLMMFVQWRQSKAKAVKTA